MQLNIFVYIFEQCVIYGLISNPAAKVEYKRSNSARKEGQNSIKIVAVVCKLIKNRISDQLK
jgi:hypothetical protein